MLIGVAAAAAACLAASLGCARKSPDIVFITIDTLRADRLSCGGFQAATTPHIQELAESGVVFEHAVTPITRTTQAVASLFTSTTPNNHRVFEIGQALDPTATTLAEVLRNAGYRTVGISANPVAGRAQGLDQGFEHFVERKQLARKHGLARPIGAQVPEGIGPAEAVTREALEALESSDERPLFLWLFYMDPHWDYNPPAPYNEVVDWSKFDFYQQMRRFRPSKATVHFNLNGAAEQFRDEISRLYDAEIHYVDTMLGPLLNSLDHDALVVLTADHGESLGEHGYYYQHGALVYQATQHVPLIISQPGRLPPGRRIREPVSTLDILPTILALAAIPDRAEREGIDLSARLRSTQTSLPPRVLLGESGSSAYPENPLRDIGGRRVDNTRIVRSGSWTVIANDSPADGAIEVFDTSTDPHLDNPLPNAKAASIADRLLGGIDWGQPDPGRWRSARSGRWKAIRIPEAERVRYELYDLETDPNETRDVSASRPEILAPLAELLDQAALASGAGNGESEPLTDEVQDQLRALGYIE